MEIPLSLGYVNNTILHGGGSPVAFRHLSAHVNTDYVGWPRFCEVTCHHTIYGYTEGQYPKDLGHISPVDIHEGTSQ